MICVWFFSHCCRIILTIPAVFFVMTQFILIWPVIIKWLIVGRSKARDVRCWRLILLKIVYCARCSDIHERAKIQLSELILQGHGHVNWQRHASWNKSRAFNQMSMSFGGLKKCNVKCCAWVIFFSQQCCGWAEIQSFSKGLFFNPRHSISNARFMLLLPILQLLLTKLSDSKRSMSLFRCLEEHSVMLHWIAVIVPVSTRYLVFMMVDFARCSDIHKHVHTASLPKHLCIELVLQGRGHVNWRTCLCSDFWNAPPWYDGGLCKL